MADDGNPVQGPALCAFLTQMMPRLKSDGFPVGAVADLTVLKANSFSDALG